MRTHALETIWTKPEQFQQAATRLANESARFRSLVPGGDAAVLNKAAGELQRLCIVESGGAAIRRDTGR